MASSQAVFLKAGDQPRAFMFGNVAASGTSTTTNQSSQPLYKEAVYSAFQAILTGTGALTATVTIQASNDDNTGRVFTFNSVNAPGTLVTTAVSTTLLSPGNQFVQALVGMSIVAPGVPAGTTVASVTNAGTLVMSAAGTAAAAVQCQFFANNWLATVLGTITLSGSGNVTDGFQSAATWRYIRATVTALTGTGAAVSVLMGN